MLTDSLANPRSFPVEEAVSLEHTYPYLIRDSYPDAIFWQLSYGNLTTQDLINQAIAYLNDWDPDFIIIQSGINDCRPEAFTELQKTLINTFSGPFFRFLRKYTYHPRLIKMRQKHRVKKWNFKKTLKKFKMIFCNSKIIFIEICAGEKYESARPGVTQRIIEFNDIAKQVYPDGIIPLQEKLQEVNGFNVDNLHLNMHGHQLVADAINEKINLQPNLMKTTHDKQ